MIILLPHIKKLHIILPSVHGWPLIISNDCETLVVENVSFDPTESHISIPNCLVSVEARKIQTIHLINCRHVHLDFGREIKRLKPKNVILSGCDAIVSNNVFNILQAVVENIYIEKAINLYVFNSKQRKLLPKIEVLNGKLYWNFGVKAI